MRVLSDRFFELFVGRAEEKPSADRVRIIQIASVVGIVCNILFATAKLVAGIIANSLSIISDAVNNYTDALSSIISLVGIRLSQKKPTREHPLGYGRIEYVSSLIVSIIVVSAGVELLRETIERFVDPATTTYKNWQIILIAVLIVGKWFLSRFTLTCGRKAHSDALIASGEDAKMDVFVSFLTLVAAILIRYIDWPYIDAIFGTVLSLFIIYTGAGLVVEASSAILGERPNKELSDAIKAILTSHEPILGAYDLILHSYGPSQQMGSVNVEISDTVTVEEAYKAMRASQIEIYAHYQIYMTIGLYSINTRDPDVQEKKRVILLRALQYQVFRLHWILQQPVPLQVRLTCRSSWIVVNLTI